MTCRNCAAQLTRVFVDLGTSPLSNAYLARGDLDSPEPHFPLRPYVCDSCQLVQLPMFETPDEIFGDYAFFSGQSETWVLHCGRLIEGLVRRHRLTRESRVLEIASNDGPLLRAAMRWTPLVTGIEPARNVARHALLDGLPTICRFFGQELACELRDDGYQADLIVANNVLAHAPDLDDFVGGIRTALAPGGVVSIEVPRLERLVEDNQFDTIYHEHFSYFSLPTLADALARRELFVTDVEWLPTHGGSMRVTARHAALGLDRHGFERALREAGDIDLAGFEHRPAQLKQRMLDTLCVLRGEGRRIAGYGAPAKATTFLTYCGIDAEMIEFIVDSTPAKQGRYLPGARIPILPPEALADSEPDVIVILPWNWRDEIAAKIARDCPWGPMVLCRDEVLADGRLAAAA
jgi:SAM-dependent methyltransferase